MSQNQPPLPSRPLVALLKTPFEGINRFILADLREGRLSMQGLSFATKTIVVFGFMLLLFGVGLSLFFPTFREQSDLIPIYPTTISRGYLIPTFLAPVILFVLTAAWAFLLAGAIRIRFWLRMLIILAFFGFNAIQLPLYLIGLAELFVVNGGLFPLLQALQPVETLLFFLALGGAFCIPVFIFIRRRSAPNPSLEFSVLFFLSFCLIQFFQSTLFSLTGTAGQSGVGLSIGANLSSAVLFIFPFLLQIGMEIGKFVRKVSFWSAEILHFRFQRNQTAIFSAVAILILLQTVGAVQNSIEFIQKNTAANSFYAYIGSACMPLFVWGLWWLINRFATTPLTFSHEEQVDEGLEPYIFPTAVVILLGALISGFLILFVSVIEAPLELSGNESSEFVSTLWRAVSLFSGDWLLWFGSIPLLIWGIWLLYKKRLMPGYFLILVSQSFLWANLARPGNLLTNLGWTADAPIDFWWSMILLFTLLNWLRKGELTIPRALSILILSIINLLVFRQTDFIEDPIFGLFQLSGIGVLAFGIIWDAITIGDWANESTPNLPRQSRVFLYLGYVLIVLSIIVWAIAEQNFLLINQFSGDGAIAGLRRLGQPMLYMLYPLLLALPKDQLPIADSSRG